MPKNNSKPDSITTDDEPLFISQNEGNIILKTKHNLEPLNIPPQEIYPIESITHPIELWGLPAPTEPLSPPLPTAHETMPPPPSSSNSTPIRLVSNPSAKTESGQLAPLPTDKQFLFLREGATLLSEGGTTPLPEEGTTSPSEEGTTALPEERTTPLSEEGTTASPEEGTTPLSEEGTTPLPEEGATSLAGEDASGCGCIIF